MHEQQDASFQWLSEDAQRRAIKKKNSFSENTNYDPSPDQCQKCK